MMLASLQRGKEMWKHLRVRGLLAADRLIWSRINSAISSRASDVRRAESRVCMHCRASKQEPDAWVLSRAPRAALRGAWEIFSGVYRADEIILSREFAGGRENSSLRESRTWNDPGAEATRGSTGDSCGLHRPPLIRFWITFEPPSGFAR